MKKSSNSTHLHQSKKQLIRYLKPICFWFRRIQIWNNLKQIEWKKKYSRLSFNKLEQIESLHTRRDGKGDPKNLENNCEFQRQNPKKIMLISYSKGGLRNIQDF